VEESRFESIVGKLTSSDGATFGEGLTEVLAIPESDPLRVRALSEAIRRRSGRASVRFYEPDVGGLTARTMEELTDSQGELLRLAQQHALLLDPCTSGNLLSAFLLFHGFDDLVALANEIENIAGSDQFQGFQLLYNQMRSAVVLKTRHGQRTWTEGVTGGTPPEQAIIRKLLIRPGQSVLFSNLPEAHKGLQHALPEGARLVVANEAADVILAFFMDRRALASGLGKLRQQLAPDGVLWVTYPRGSHADIAQDAVDAGAKSIGMVCDASFLMDDTWSARRLKAER